MGRGLDALHSVGLLPKALARVDRLSGGERQRVGIARALIKNPEILLGDEPFAAMDVAFVGYLGRQFRELVADRQMTVVLVLHQLDAALELADRLIGLSEGRVAFDGPPSTFDVTARERIFGSRRMPEAPRSTQEEWSGQWAWSSG
jgi:phosphonate transport system ATP-binding protein